MSSPSATGDFSPPHRPTGGSFVQTSDERDIQYTDGTQLPVSERVYPSARNFEYRVCSKDSDTTAAPGCGAWTAAELLAKPMLTVTPDSGLDHIGQQVSVHGTGYPPDRDIHLDQCRPTYCNAGTFGAAGNTHTDENGEFTTTVVPAFVFGQSPTQDCSLDDCYIRAYNTGAFLGEWYATAPIEFAEDT